jgi:hypothetical protein
LKFRRHDGKNKIPRLGFEDEGIAPKFLWGRVFVLAIHCPRLFFPPGSNESWSERDVANEAVDAHFVIFATCETVGKYSRDLIKVIDQDWIAEPAPHA